MADVMTSEITKTISGEAVNFYTPREQRIRSLKVYFSPKQAGTGTPSPENVRPISGWTGVEVSHCGKNLFDYKNAEKIEHAWLNGGLVKSTTSYDTYSVPVPKNTVLVVSKVGNVGSIIGLGKKSAAIGDSVIGLPTFTNRPYYSFNTGDNDYFLLSFNNAYNLSNHNLQLELGSGVTDYTPYETKISSGSQPQHIVWEEDFGTIYGGYVDLVSGELVEEKYYATLDGVNNYLNYGGAISGDICHSYCTYGSGGLKNLPKGHSKTLSGGYKELICDTFKTSMSAAGVGETVQNDNQQTYIRLVLSLDSVGISSDATATQVRDAINNWLNENPINICYTLATPITHQLSPTTLSTLMGDNNFWSNADRIEIEYDYIGIFKPLESRKNVMSGTPHLVTVKDDVVSFGTDMAVDLKECKVYFKPKQDLHGYDKPWIGGSGKNLFDINTQNNGYGINNSGQDVSTTDGAFSDLMPVKENSTYTFSATSNSSSNWYRRIHFYNSNKEWVEQGAEINPGVVGSYSITVTIPEGISYIRVSYRGGINYANHDTNPQLELGSTATSYEPYENICPIEGWDGIEITHGINILDGLSLTYHGNASSIYSVTGKIASYTALGNACETFIDISTLRGRRLTLNHRPTGKSGGFAFYSDANVNSFISGIGNGNVGTQGEWTINVPSQENINYMRFTANPNYIDDVKILLDIEKTSVTFPQTIYGGYVDLVKGEVVEEYTNVTGWTQYKQNNGFIAYRADTSNYNANNWLCNMIGEYGSFNTSNMTKNIIQNVKVGNYNYLALDKTANINDLVVVLPLKTPNTYSLTPQTITTLRGANTIWTNSNDETEVKYYTHGDDSYQHVPTSDAITSSDDFLLVTDDGYVIGTEDDFITY